MNSENSLLDEYYACIAEQLSISDTMREKAERAYGSVGEWLDKDPNHPTHIYTQGSFALGTVTRPLSGDDDDYDIDLVCELPDMSLLEPRVIKHTVGNRLKSHGLYSQKLEPEGKRCWTLVFDEFHMDILPCTPNSIWSQDTSITLTNKEPNGSYTSKTSNPKAYQTWFENRMGERLFDARKKRYDANRIAYSSVDKVPTFSVQTPLQMAIQILKHHRDIMFEGSDNAPISIIITTLAALSYQQTEGVFETVRSVLKDMTSHVQGSYGDYWIPNPVDSMENFADRWNENPAKAKAFFDWIEAAQRDLVDKPLGITGIHRIADVLSGPLNKSVIGRATTSFGNSLTERRQTGSLYVTASSGIGITGARQATTVRDHSFFGA